MEGSKKVRLACRRCRARRIKCDGGVPACTNCAKSGHPCVDVDIQNSGVPIPRNFVSNSRARIQWLEDIIRTRLPDVDLSAGPQVDALGEETRPARESPAEHSRSQPESNTGTSVPPPRSRKRLTEETSPSDNDTTSIAEGAHSAAYDLGMLSLNSDSSQRQYLGSSSGKLFTTLIGATPPSQKSGGATGGQGLFGASAAVQSAVEAARIQNMELNLLLRKELPDKDTARSLVNTYIRSIHPEYPVLEVASLLNILEVLYEACSYPLDMNDPLLNGWPASVACFRWNGRDIFPAQDPDPAISISRIAFIFFMVLNIAAIVMVRSHVYEHSPEKFYQIALQFAPSAFSCASISTTQAIVMLVLHGLATPADVNLWTLVHMSIASCVEIGIHRDNPSPVEEDRDYEQMKRYVFFTIYHLDRSISCIQGRPLGFRDETFDAKMPTTVPSRPDWLPTSFLSAVDAYAHHQFQLDRIVSDIKLKFYHLPGKSSLFSIPHNPLQLQLDVERLLARWWDDAAAEPFADDLDAQQRHIWNLKLRIRYHTTRLLLFQPSQVLRKPSDGSLAKCFNDACSILESYQALHELHALHHSWRGVQNVFAAGVILIYSFWTSKFVQASPSVSDMSRALRTCSSLLSVGGEWWPSVKRASVNFGSTADVTIQKLYTDAVMSKHLRLSTSTETQSRSDGERMHSGPAMPGELDMAAHQGRSEGTFGITYEPVPVQHGMMEQTNPSASDCGLLYPTNTVGQLHAAAAGGDSLDPYLLGDEAEPERYAPEIEDFFAEIDRAEFNWGFLHVLDGGDYAGA